MEEDMRYYGQMVVFTDGYGRARVGRVVTTRAADDAGQLGIDVDGEHGTFLRRPEMVRLAETWEVHQAMLMGGFLD